MKGGSDSLCVVEHERYVRKGRYHGNKAGRMWSTSFHLAFCLDCTRRVCVYRVPSNGGRNIALAGEQPELLFNLLELFRQLRIGVVDAQSCLTKMGFLAKRNPTYLASCHGREFYLIHYYY